MAEPIRLRGITWDHPRGLDSVRAAARGATSGGRAIEVEWQARSLLAFGDAPLARLVEIADLVVLDHPHVPAAATEGLLRPLPATAPPSVGRSAAGYRWQGAQVALPIDGAAQVSAFRPDLLPVPPRTWSEVLDLAAAGGALWPGATIDAFSSLFAVAAASGWRAAAGDDVPFDGALAVDALRVLTRLRAATPEADRELNPIQALDRLSRDHGPVFAPLVFGYTNYARAGFRPHLLRFTDAPVGAAGVSGSLLGGAGIAVSARSGRPEAAAAVAARLAAAEVQRGEYFDAGGQPAAVAAWEDERLDAETDGFFRGTRSTLDDAVLRSRRTGWMAFQGDMAAATTDVLRGATTETAFAKAWNRARAALGRTPGDS